MARKVGVAVALSLVCLTVFPSTVAAKNPLKQFGFRALYPPRSDICPGDLVVVELRSRNRANINKVICDRERAFDDAQIDHGRIAGFDLVRSRTIFGELAAGVLARIESVLGVNHVKRSTLTLENARILVLPDDEACLGATRRTDACEQMRQARLKTQTGSNERVTVISQVLLADAEMTVSWDLKVDLSAQDKEGSLENIALALGGGFSVQSHSVLKGPDLVWGIREDRFLAKLAPVDCEQHKTVFSGPSFATWSSYGDFMELRQSWMGTEALSEVFVRLPEPAIPDDYVVTFGAEEQTPDRE